MAAQPTYQELPAEVTNLTVKIAKLEKYIQSKSAHGLVPSGVKIEQPTILQGVHDGTSVRNFVNACDAYFKLVGIADDKTRALFTQMWLVETARTQYDGQGYGAQSITQTQLHRDLLTYFVPVDHARQARKSLMLTKQGKCYVQAYIDGFRKALLDCTDVQEAEAKFVFENNLADWLVSLVLPHQNQNLRDSVLCAQSIGSIERVYHQPTTKCPPRTNDGPIPIVLGKFKGECHRCGKTNHKKAQCRVHPSNFVKSAQAKRGRLGKQQPKNAQPVRRGPQKAHFGAAEGENTGENSQLGASTSPSDLAVQVAELTQTVATLAKND